MRRSWTARGSGSGRRVHLSVFAVRVAVRSWAFIAVFSRGRRCDHAALFSFDQLLREHLPPPPPSHHRLHRAEQIKQTQQDGQRGDAQHETEHERLLGAPGDVAFHPRGAGGLVAQEALWKGQTKELKLACPQNSFQKDPDNHHQEVRAVEAWSSGLLELALVQGQFPGPAGVLQAAR